MQVGNYRFALGRSNMEDMAGCGGGGCLSREQRRRVEGSVERSVERTSMQARARIMSENRMQ